VLLGRQETDHLQTSPFLHLPLLVSQGNQEQLCGPCICIIGESLAPAAAAAGITPEQVQSTSEADARALITACAGVLIRPTSIVEIRRTADERVLMPPKSTFFTPKLRTGPVLRPLD